MHKVGENGLRRIRFLQPGGVKYMNVRGFFSAALSALIFPAVLSGCGQSGSGSDLIRVGIINNDPNESGYRTANVNDLKKTFTKENGYDADFK